MTRRAREIETIVLAMFAAVPLYFNHAIGAAPVIAFHVFMAAVAVRVWMGRGPELVPAMVMRGLAMMYVPFYLVDWLGISHSAVAASTHITVLLFVILFAFLMFRQLMYVSHIETVRAVEVPYAEPPVARTAMFYLAGATLIGAALFPLLPRVRNPFVQGLTGPISGASTGLSDSIDFSDPRTASPGDSTVVARVWMDLETRPFFTPLRLRGNLYDRFEDGRWKQSFRGLREVGARNGEYVVARPNGVKRKATVQQRAQRGKLFLPVGTYALSGAANLYEGPARETYHTYERGMLNLEVSMADRAEPLRLVREQMTGYPISPRVEALARQIVGGEVRPERRAALIEAYLLRNYRYLPNSASPAKAVPLDDFLLVERAGNCEYFAAGMVALLNAVDVPARIAGGFYGGRHNPLTGYYSIRREDAHAWTEVWDGTRWLTFDATPASLRPGTEGVSALRMYLSALSDSVTYFWDRYVLTFGLSDQVTLFTDMITWIRETSGRVRSDARQLVSPRFLLIFGAVIGIGAALIALSRRRRRTFDLLAAFLKERGIEVSDAMTMEDALRSLDRDTARAIAPLVALYEEEEFSGRRDPTRRRMLRRRLAELR